MTVLEVLQSTTAYFARRGIDQPRLNIEHLLADSLGKRRLDLYLEFDRELTGAELAILRQKVKRRADREPLQHVLGHWDFYGRTFATDARALVPRPETELLVEEVLERLPKAEDGVPRLVADVGTGSGVIAITVALERPTVRVLAIDRETGPLSLARENAARHAVSERVSFLNGDLLTCLPEPVYAVVANLPYIPSGDIAQLSPEVRRDPLVALDGGPDGLDLIRRLVKEARSWIKSGGWLFLEVGAGQAPAAAAMLADENYRDIFTRRDYQGTDRVVRACNG
ncbi:MAG TPA: peptide chain release factor N(5)-glutamine methyltransferase [Chthoniobacterales bacterium]